MKRNLQNRAPVLTRQRAEASMVLGCSVRYGREARQCLFLWRELFYGWRVEFKFKSPRIFKISKPIDANHLSVIIKFNFRVVLL